MMGQLDFLVTLAAFSFFVGLQSYEDGQQYETPWEMGMQDMKTLILNQTYSDFLTLAGAFKLLL